MSDKVRKDKLKNQELIKLLTMARDWIYRDAMGDTMETNIIDKALKSVVVAHYCLQLEQRQG